MQDKNLVCHQEKLTFPIWTLPPESAHGIGWGFLAYFVKAM